jgi:hypothetical protein
LLAAPANKQTAQKAVEISADVNKVGPRAYHYDAARSIELVGKPAPSAMGVPSVMVMPPVMSVPTPCQMEAEFHCAPAPEYHHPVSRVSWVPWLVFQMLVFA